MVIAVLVLPAFLLATLGVLEAGNAYRQSVAAARAAAAAAVAAADVVGPGIDGAPLPPFAEMAATDAARRVIGDTVELVSVEARWGDAPRDVTPYPGEDLEAVVPLPRFDPGSTTLRWGESHGFSYQFPTYRVATRVHPITPSMGNYVDTWLSRADVTTAAPQHQHNRGDTGLWAQYNTITGFVVWTGAIIPWWCTLCPIPVAGWAFGWSNSPWVQWAGVYDFQAGTGPSAGSLTRPGYFYQSASRPVTASSGPRVDRWLEQAGWEVRRAQSEPNPQEAVVGEYAVYMGDEDTQQVAARDPDALSTRIVSVTVSVRLRALSPIAGAWFDRLVVTRTASAEARL